MQSYRNWKRPSSGPRLSAAALRELKELGYAGATDLTQEDKKAIRPVVFGDKRKTGGRK